MWPYTERQTQEAVRQVAERVEPGFEGEIRFLAAGSNNEVFLATAGERRFVVRVTGARREIRSHRERWCLRQADAIGIPSPKVIDAGMQGEVAYLTMTFLEGRPGVDAPEIPARFGQRSDPRFCL